MSEFVDGLTNPAWWLSVVFVGISINIASNYLQLWIGRVRGYFSHRAKERYILDKKRMGMEAVHISGDPLLIILKSQQDLGLRMLSVSLLLLSFLPLLCFLQTDQLLRKIPSFIPGAKVLFLLLFLVGYSYSMNILGRSVRLMRVVDMARMSYEGDRVIAEKCPGVSDERPGASSPRATP